MHVHKINSTSEEHQNFLAQNRIDPITGDTVLEGDEVVFCASCKSVFLKDTWEYLGKEHCEQSKTLAKFPVQKAMNLKSDNDILFYTSHLSSGIPSKAKGLPWIRKSSYKNYNNLEGGSFYITKKSIGFISKYATEEYILQIEYIERLVFYERNNVFSSSFFQISYVQDGVKEVVRFNVNSIIFKNPTALFIALNIFSSIKPIPIHIESKNKETLNHIQKVIKNGNPNFHISNI